MAFNHPMPQLHKKTFADEQKSSNRTVEKKKNGERKNNFPAGKPTSFQNRSAKMFPSRSAKPIMERSARLNTDRSITPTIVNSVLLKMRRSVRLNTRN